MRLKGSVGQGGRNDPKDVTYVQILLADWQLVNNLPAIKVDGLAGPKTITAIRTFQSKNIAVTDGLVEPNRSTIKALENSHLKVIANVTLSPLLQGMIKRNPLQQPGTIGMTNPDRIFEVYLNALRGD